MQSQTLLEMTKQMIEAAEKGADRYQEGKDSDLSYDFFETIKPAVEENDVLAARWAQGTLELIKARRPKYVHREQIETAKDNFQELVLQSYVHHIHKKRFKDITESVLYTLHAVKDEIAREDSR
ncbi:YppE family protein [Bacillus inaquosorum]|uniref:YppE family protein n=1 Tax=Bacillus inaquosorum TaxID=483913 RepID=UPI002282DD27|nr:YppE family protein [Bacillus inaquosorum]MCY7950419.1 YppE family protein [Bacillus inaquosorum]MCY8389964.1 YppE family protein [Bacillus inaquosorum]MCY8854727.1 YppE family protein [Bacillus inaquosorum]MEC0522018.1 YppE family protein [Bacillus inaquosorum]MEC0608508.1 YppE family protein [Bacillus inaquosorum]